MCIERRSAAMDEEGGGGGGEDDHQQLFTRADLQQWDREAVRKSLFAQTLQKKLRRLQGRRISEPADVMTAAKDGKAKLSKDDLFVRRKEVNVVGNEDEEEELDLELDKGRMSFLLGRFLSGSDPSLCSTAAVSVSAYSSGSSRSSRSDSLEGGLNLEGGAFGGDVVERGKTEVAAENMTEPPTLKFLCSNSSGYGSERDIREEESGAGTEVASTATDEDKDARDFLVPHAWVEKHFSPNGSNSSGYSTPTPTSAATPTPVDFVRDSSPAFESHVSDADALSSTPRADEGIFFSAKPHSPSPPRRQPEFLTITSGEEKHKVATTKLNALIALLDSSSASSSSAKASSKLSRSAPDLLTAKDFTYGQDASSDNCSGISTTVNDVDGPRSLVMDDELKSEKPNKMRKASSLKTGKTPPGTPGRAKIVR